MTRTTDISIREVRPDDAAAVAGILNRIIEAGTFTVFDRPVGVDAERAYIERFPARGVFLVAERPDRGIVGFQSMEPFAAFTRAFDHVGVLGTYVDLDERRQGIASRLFAATLASSRQKGYLENLHLRQSGQSGGAVHLLASRVLHRRDRPRAGEDR